MIRLPSPGNTTPASAIATSALHTAECEIPSMDCEACAAPIRNQLLKHPGVITASVSYEKKNAVIEYDSSKTSMASIIEAINSAGFNVTASRNHSK